MTTKSRTPIDRTDDACLDRELNDDELDGIAGGMFPASSKGGGHAMSGPTDVCKTPTPGGPVPIPMPGITGMEDDSASKVPGASKGTDGNY